MEPNRKCRPLISTGPQEIAETLNVTVATAKTHTRPAGPGLGGSLAVITN